MRYAGRTARKKYAKMSEKEKEEFRKKWGLTALSTVSFCAVGTMVYYRIHLETLEISRRTRFICTSPEYENKIGIESYENLILEDESEKALPMSDPRYKRVKRVLRQLTEAIHDSNDLPIEAHEMQWAFTVMANKKGHKGTVNACCVPGGKIIVYTGLLDLLDSDHTLAFLMGHEMAHAICRHTGETLSVNYTFHTAAMLLITGLIWFLMPFGDMAAFVTDQFMSYLMKMVLELPNSRMHEMEADHVGTLLMSRACFNPHKASRLIDILTVGQKLPEQYDEAKLRRHSEAKGGDKDWSSTHPSHIRRVEDIDEIYLPEALDQRRACGCPAIRNDRLSADNKADSVRRFWMRSGPKPADPSRCTGGTRRKCEAECDGMPTAAAFLSCMNSCKHHCKR